MSFTANKVEGEFSMPNFLQWATTATYYINTPALNNHYVQIYPPNYLGTNTVQFHPIGNTKAFVCLVVGEQEVHLPKWNVQLPKLFAREISIDELKREPQKYLNNGRIRIRIRLYTSDGTDQAPPTKDNDELAEDLNSVLLSSELSDVVLVCGSEKIPCHKIILSARSKVFRAMFQHDTKESVEGTVEIEDVTPESVKTLVKFFYTNKVDDSEITPDLLKAADKYESVSLGKRCVEYLCKNLTVENAVDCFMLAYLHNAEKLKQKSIRMITANYNAISETKVLDRFAESHPKAIMEILKISCAKKPKKNRN